MQAKQITVHSTGPLEPQTMHVGDVLSIYAPGEEESSVVLVSDASHFRLIEHGKTPDDSSHFMWRLVATDPGDAIVTLSPACRQSKPPCMLPDRALRVAILP